MSLPTVGWFHITTRDEPPCGIQRAKAQRGAVRRIQRDLFAIGRHVECWNRREGVFRESRLSFVLAFGGCAWRWPGERLRHYIRKPGGFCLRRERFSRSR